MSTSFSSASAPAVPAGGPSPHPRPSLLPALAGGALVLGTVAFLAGGLTSPSQQSRSAADYIASLARDPLVTAASALLLHWGNILIGLGAPAIPSLLRGPRGRRFVVPGAVLTALGFVNVSGLVLSDWWNAAAGAQLSPEQATSLFDAVWNGPLLQLWKGTQSLAFAGLLLMLVGLIRAGVLRWWVALLLPAGIAGTALIPLSQPQLVAGAAALAFAPLTIMGVRLVSRWRVERARSARS